ncbi:hypothetical protein [Deinococcus irradiatisoli]|uniref:hypothetical protein n=1 Tax=Deinococcus irradiatisoli TaxID=2202254 RepID=UPI001FE990E8|nr:hypothetical protein [Deinococcus irradiatisoli]
MPLTSLYTSYGVCSCKTSKKPATVATPATGRALRGFHIEAKITATCKMHSPAQLREWDAQAQRDAGQFRTPLVIHRWNGNKTWWVRLLKPGWPAVWLTLPEFLTSTHITTFYSPWWLSSLRLTYSGEPMTRAPVAIGGIHGRLDLLDALLAASTYFWAT